MAMRTRRTLRVIWAPILSSFRRIVPQVAFANWVWAEARKVPTAKPLESAGGEADPAQRAGIRGDRPAVEPGGHDTAGNLSKFELLRATLCRHRGTPLLREIPFLQKNFRRSRAPMHLPRVRNRG